jgi:signal transduction histidine kinase
MISLIVAVGMLIVWAAGMYCLTAVTAEYAAARYYETFSTRAEDLARDNLSYDRSIGLDEKYENYEASRMWEVAAKGGRNFYITTAAYSINEERFLRRAENERYCYGVIAVFDNNGNLIVSSDEDYFFFEYMSEDDWFSGQERSMQNMRVLFDRNKLTSNIKDWFNQHRGGISGKAAALRFTGFYDDAGFTPTLIEYIDHYEFWDNVPVTERHPLSASIQTYGLEWKTMYSDSEAAANNAEIITLYSDWFDVCYTEASPAFRYQGKNYDNVSQLARELGPTLLQGYLKNSDVKFSLDKPLIIPSTCYSFNIGEKTYYDNLHQKYSDSGKSINYYALSIVYTSPWLAAFCELRVTYIVTLLFAAVIVTVILLIIRRHLIMPVQAVCDALCSEDPFADIERYRSRRWYEGNRLQEGFINSRKAKQKLQDEISRLNTALEYAKTAEANRRRMVSDIAHELKTPLAVIHGYAEGLQEHIAEDKRDKYVSVILSESERTDRMVLEMLELSRLEAGRVKLQRGEFSLTELTRAVFERLYIQAREKRLELKFEMPSKATVNADERRIAQVVENLATNAIKYTPEGGHIHVRIYSHDGRVSFSIENDSEPLSRDQLKNVWEAFYRTDESRTGRSTGLGLAIVRNIVELHGGRCIAMNTEKGVKFGFVI